MLRAGPPSKLRDSGQSLQELLNRESLRESLSQTKNPIKGKLRVNNVDDSSSEAATVGTSATVEEQVNQSIRCYDNKNSMMQITSLITTTSMTTG